jgi:hypothetical protein
MGNSNALATSFAFPFGLAATGTAYTPVVDQVALGLSRLLEQFKPKPLINALVEAPLDYGNTIETVLYDLLTKRLLDGAVGVQLDVVGAIFGVERDGRSDSAFLQFILATALAQDSSGTVPDVYGVLERIAPGGAFQIDQLIEDPAGFGVRFTSPTLPTTPATADDLVPVTIERLLRKSRGAGIKCWFSWWPTVEADLFTLCDGNDPIAGSALGMSDDAMTTGGKLIGEVIA